MNSKTNGIVVPFAMPAARMRRRAADYRKQGQPVAAVELLRQAMEREDTCAVRLELAEALMGLACWEQASQLLYRTLAHPDAPADTWMLLARCQQALGRTISAQDSLYHYLMLDPYSDQADHARAMLNDGIAGDERQEKARLAPLWDRAMNAWRSGDKELSHRRMQRALRIAADPAPLYMTLALLYMREDDYRSAAVCFAKALRRNPGMPKALTGLALCEKGMGRKRVSHAMLMAAARHCTAPMDEAAYLSAAWACGDIAAIRAYLTAGLKRAPNRIALMQPMAAFQLYDGDAAYARRLLERVLRIDPSDERARFGLKHMDEHPGEPLPEDGSIPVRELRGRMMMLVEAAATGAAAEQLAQGGQLRMLADWAFTMPDRELQAIMLRTILLQGGQEAENYLRELLTLPTVMPQVREECMLRLHDMGVTEPIPMLLGPRMTVAQCFNDATGRKRWPMFLELLLLETRRLRQSQPIAFFAAALWDGLTPRQRMLATGEGSYAWMKAAELLYLYHTEQSDEAARVLRRLQVSVRKVRRALLALSDHTVDLCGGLLCEAEPTDDPQHH